MIWNLFKRKQEKELTPLERKLKEEGEELENILKEQGYEEVRHSIFNNGCQEYENRIDYDEGKKQYRVMNTHERAFPIGRIDYFDDFEEAKKEFLKRIRTRVIINRERVLRGDEPTYYCSVWNEWEGTEEDVMTPEEREERERKNKEFDQMLLDFQHEEMKKEKAELLSKVDELGYPRNLCCIYEDEPMPNTIRLTSHNGTRYLYQVSTIDSNKQVIGEIGKHEEFEDAEQDFLERLKEKYESQ